ncbi:heterokaryon incompatibility protein-domain-containing protein, partial [Clohesyomyces aquaticus]
MSTYKYQDLVNDDEVRLLVVNAGNENDELVCSLIHARLSENPEFEAVSYTWGPDILTQTIILDGYVFPVRENIFHALRKFRYNSRPRTLWADAICINQNNIPERSKQVKLMKRVYETAKHVLIWLG